MHPVVKVRLKLIEMFLGSERRKEYKKTFVAKRNWKLYSYMGILYSLIAVIGGIITIIFAILTQ